jgi:hypothetical protein
MISPAQFSASGNQYIITTSGHVVNSGNDEEVAGGTWVAPGQSYQALPCGNCPPLKLAASTLEVIAQLKSLNIKPKTKPGP